MNAISPIAATALTHSQMIFMLASDVNPPNVAIAKAILVR